MESPMIENLCAYKALFVMQNESERVKTNGISYSLTL